MMNRAITDLLSGKAENHILPFFWQHGEDEDTLRKYVRVMDEANCHAFCVESRPHPDFCGEKWWTDMDAILDEARKRNMKVWILDDSHFPTGFANGAVKSAPLELHRQSVCANPVRFTGAEEDITLELSGLIPPPFKPAGIMEQYVIPALIKDAPHFEDDTVIAVTAVNGAGEEISLPLPEAGKPLRWHKPEGDWTVWVIGLSRNCGPHREYINMLDAQSCRLLLDAVYEPHWQHYAADFGKTIAGFFSDEPELGNGHLYFYDNMLGTDQDLPFSAEMPAALEARLGQNWQSKLFLLWENGMDADETARVRFAYMDAVTTLLRENFSRQIGSWCREHGVEYIGHMIEDGNAHARTGSSLGHYFRGLDGQDMSGIDDIGGQVLPQGEVEPKIGNLMQARDGEFYHYQMANLAASAAAIQPEKHGNAMCEIFGNYGWAEGVHLEKYLADHFLVRGINNFVPHAFSPAPFPDPDCPPHFYAHGHNPQYRHFGALMGYMNRVSTLISGGHRAVTAAILYHGEAEWAGKAMLSQKAARILAEAQVEFDTIPCDVFVEPERYRTVLGSTLKVNTQEYSVLIVPQSQFVTAAFAKAAARLHENGMMVCFLNSLPEGIMDGDNALLDGLAACPVLSLEQLRDAVQPEAKFIPSSTYLRSMHYQGRSEFYFFVNEANETYHGSVTLPNLGSCYWYDPWNNRIYPASPKGNSLNITLEPLHSAILVLDEADPALLMEPVSCAGEEIALAPWLRSTCDGIDYPAFGAPKAVTLPDNLAQEQPAFSGFARYESSFDAQKGQKIALELTEAYEGVEVFVNGRSAGIQIVPPYRYDLTDLVQTGENALAIEVATTLERQCYDALKDDVRSKMRGLKEPSGGSGITGTVIVHRQ
ncbi:MAG: hypothetical protein ACI4PO_02780 [Faecousia sp.]